MFPDFLVIGAQKAGTTWLQRNLRSHPQIWMPKEKEIHYFDEKIHLRGGLVARLLGNGTADLRWRRQVRSRFKQPSKQRSLRDVAWDLKYFLKKPDDSWYASLFEPGKGKITGETTPDYSVLGPKAIAHVRELMPEAKIVLMMRNPIERPWSALGMGLRFSGGSVEDLTDEEAVRQLSNPRTRLMTDYLNTLSNWGSYYPEERIFVGFLEDVHFFPEEFLGRLHGFLSVDASAEYRVITRKIHSGFRDTMPTRFASFLARAYREDAGRLRERFGGYASFWLRCAERLAEDPPEGGDIPYPLHESYLWGQWPGSRRIAVQSGPLASIRPHP